MHIYIDPQSIVCDCGYAMQRVDAGRFKCPNTKCPKSKTVFEAILREAKSAERDTLYTSDHAG